MEPIVLIAATLTVVLGTIALLCAVVGIVLRCLERTRFLAPYVTFIPTLAILGAMAGAWGLGYLAATSEVPGMSDGPLWAWLIGLPVGGFLGGFFGVLLARLSTRGLSRRWRPKVFSGRLEVTGRHSW